MADTQRPRDISNEMVSMKSYTRPNDTGGPIRAGSSQRAKDDTAAIKMQGNKIAKDVDRPIRVTSIPLPKNIDGQVEAKKKKQT
jgi:hypothetical protein